MTGPRPTWDGRAGAIARDGLILRGLVGSTVHGTSVEDTDDRDEMGVCIEPPAFVIGLQRFEQYVFRTQPEGARSGPGDLDLTVFSLRKWMRLALTGNPSILLLLYAPEEALTDMTPLGRSLRDNAGRIVSRQAGHRFLGYLDSQRQRLLGTRKGRAMHNRPELIEAYGFDTKFAGHMVRLGLQGVELLSTGRLTLPMPQAARDLVLRVRTGHHTQEQVIEMTDGLEEQLRALLNDSPLPERPDSAWADRWLTEAYTRHWSGA